MAYDGLEAFVRALEREGELVRIKHEVDPYLEAAEIADRTMKGGGPALLFERVRGSQFPLLINAFGSRRRMSLALGVSDLEDHARAIEQLVKTRAPKSARELADLARQLPALAHTVPRRVSNAPCHEVVLTGEAVDLEALPVMTTWPKDGGPFITLPNVITKDPDTGARNVGMYRMQRIDRATTAMHWQVHKTGARHFRRAKELGVRLPVAVALGGDPALTYAATAPLPDGIDEWMFGGFLRGRAVDVVRCKTVDLEVPADADFVLEGYVDPREPLFDEGPFGDHTGYYTPVDAFPRFHVTALTRRRNPVYPATLVGPPPMEDAWLGKATERLFLPLLRMLFPEVVDMNLPVEGAFHNLVVVSIKKQYPFHAAKIAHGLWGSGQMSFSKVICIVDEDVNVQNLAEVSWRILANLDPKRDIAMVDGPVDQLDHASNQGLWGGKMALDGTRKWPEEGYTRQWPEVCRQAEDVRRRVDAMWSDLGLSGLGIAALSSQPGAAPGLGRAASSTTASTTAAGPATGGTGERVVANLRDRKAAPLSHARANRALFERIAPTYDRLNRLLSLGIDRRWRAQAVATLSDTLGTSAPNGAILDLCAGTLDVAAVLERVMPHERLVACDASEAMLELGATKVRRTERVVGDALALPFEDGSFAAVICGFGIRNVADLDRALEEVRRVIQPCGVFVNLEFFAPAVSLARGVHRSLLRRVVPTVGRLVSGDEEAYRYLAESMEAFTTRAEYERALARHGFVDVVGRDLTLAIASVVRARLPSTKALAKTPRGGPLEVVHA